MKIIQDADIKDKKVLLRTDFNVPMEGEKIVDDLRIREALPTIKLLLEKGASQIIIITHLGRPNGHEDEFCLWPIANRLMELLNIQGKYYDCPQNDYRISENILMLENLRFDAGEEENDIESAKHLASLGDIFVQDAFGTCHRAHASTVGVAEILPSYAGLLVQKEVDILGKLIAGHTPSYTVILGGAKTADKLPVIKNLLSRADNFLIGGALADTFLAARGHHLGKSLIEKDSFQEANLLRQNILDEAQKNIFLPTDLVISKSIEKNEDLKVVEIGEFLQPKFEEYSAVDIGPKTRAIYAQATARAKMIFWNGNMGISEIVEFSNGTKAIAEAIAKSSAKKYAGGGDTTAFIRQNHFEDKFDFLSTGGGATLEFLSGKVLPGLKVLG